jgi:hypothetical protein
MLAEQDDSSTMERIRNCRVLPLLSVEISISVMESIDDHDLAKK